MTIRERLADALREAGVCEVEPSRGNYFGCTPERAADALLALPGIAIVELPAYSEEYGCFMGAGYGCCADTSDVVPGGMVRAGIGKYLAPAAARKVAAALLAAANAAEAAE